jgi:hypothetical protein
VHPQVDCQCSQVPQQPPRVRQHGTAGGTAIPACILAVCELGPCPMLAGGSAASRRRRRWGRWGRRSGGWRRALSTASLALAYCDSQRTCFSMLRRGQFAVQGQTFVNMSAAGGALLP